MTQTETLTLALVVATFLIVLANFLSYYTTRKYTKLTSQMVEKMGKSIIATAEAPFTPDLQVEFTHDVLKIINNGNSVRNIWGTIYLEKDTKHFSCDYLSSNIEKNFKVVDLFTDKKLGKYDIFVKLECQSFVGGEYEFSYEGVVELKSENHLHPDSLILTEFKRPWD